MLRFCRSILIAFLVILPAAAQTPQCSDRNVLTTATTSTPTKNNTTNPNCNAWALTWNSTGFSGLTIQLEGSDDGTSFTPYSGTTTVLVGTNPASTLSGAIVIQASTKLAYLRVHATSVTGSGAINWQLYGSPGVTPAAKNGGGSGPATVSWTNVTPGTNSQGFLQVHSPTVLEPTPMNPGGIYATQVVDANDLPAITVTTPGGAAIDFFNIATSLGGGGATVTAQAAGADGNVNLLVQAKGSGQVEIPLQMTFLSSGSAGNYTLANSAVFVKKSDGTELLRAWCTDPDFIDDSFNVSNCYFGYQAGFSQPTDNTSAGSLNSGFGAYALYSISTGFDNTALGFGALFGVTSGSDNTGIGYETMYNSTSATGNENTAIGAYAIESNQSGSGNVAIGYAAMYNNTSGSNNLAIGFEACQNQSTLTNSICLGNGTSLTDGIANAMAIGNSASAGVSNEIVLGGTAVTQTVLPDGDLYIASSSRGLILTDTATSTCYRVQMTSGVLAWTSLGSCPAF